MCNLCWHRKKPIKFLSAATSIAYMSSNLLSDQVLKLKHVAQIDIFLTFQVQIIFYIC